MKQLVLLLSAFLIMSVSDIFAQCTPVPFSGPSLTNPDTTAGIQVAAETQAYTQIIQIRIPADTNFNGAIIPIDSAGIENVTGMPSSISWLSNSPNNYWPGDTFGCVIIQGTPQIGEAGNYNVEIIINVHALGSTMPYTLNYSFEILDASFAGIDLLKSQDFQVFQNQPNPFSYSTQINFFTPQNDITELNVFDILGNKVISRRKESKMGKNSFLIEKGNLPAGIYIYELKFRNNVIRKRMIIK